MELKVLVVEWEVGAFEICFELYSFILQGCFPGSGRGNQRHGEADETFLLGAKRVVGRYHGFLGRKYRRECGLEVCI